MGLASHTVLPISLLRQTSRRALRVEEPPRRIHRAKRRDAVLPPDGVVFLAVSRRRMDRARALFQRHVVGQNAQRIALQERMVEHRAFERARPGNVAITW